jgi:signal transduction histidine kinase
MKLLTRSTYYFFIFSIAAMIIAGVAFYYTIRAIVYKQIDDSLKTEKTIIQDQIEETDSIPDFAASFGHQIEVRLLKSPALYSQTIRDTDIYDVKSASYLPYRHLWFTSNTPRKTGYVISIYQVLDENQELLDSISLGMFFLFLSLFLVSIFVNYLISKKIWSPFYKSVNEAANFTVLSDDPINLPVTTINEFNQLNRVFEQMTKKMRTDYINLKEYNENSSHEIKTPLAVIRSKLDILMQNEGLNSSSMELIKSINDAVSHIFKLNQGLLLMSKIENLQFQETKDLSLKGLVENYLQNFEEIMHLKKINVETDFSDQGIVRMNDLLADVLISNLLGNAVRYNIDEGYIICRLDDTFLTIVNSGLPLKVDTENLFKRFHKGNDHPESVGLGLSIVKKICDHYKMEISYSSTGTIHEIRLKYRDQSAL